jgi:CRP-like cAMP-binding protein
MREIDLKHFTVIPTPILIHGGLNPNAKLLYGVLLMRYRDGDFMLDDTTNRDLAEILNVSIRSVQRWLGELQDYGYVSVEVEKNENGTTRYISIVNGVGA